jgi:predicted nucleic acid-binding Zn ribbon protein
MQHTGESHCLTCRRPLQLDNRISLASYCSKRCYDKSRRDNTRTLIAECRTCRESIKPKRVDSKFCSSKCRPAAYRKRKEETE